MNEFKESQWIYGSLTGFTLVMFLSTFQALDKSDSSTILCIAFTIFSCLLPTFSVFTVVNFIFVNRPGSHSKKILKEPWVITITLAAMCLLWIGFALFVYSALNFAFYTFCLSTLCLGLAVRYVFSRAYKSDY